MESKQFPLPHDMVIKLTCALGYKLKIFNVKYMSSSEIIVLLLILHSSTKTFLLTSPKSKIFLQIDTKV